LGREADDDENQNGHQIDDETVRVGDVEGCGRRPDDHQENRPGTQNGTHHQHALPITKHVNKNKLPIIHKLKVNHISHSS